MAFLIGQNVATSVEGAKCLGPLPWGGKHACGSGLKMDRLCPHEKALDACLEQRYPGT